MKARSLFAAPKVVSRLAKAAHVWISCTLVLCACANSGESAPSAHSAVTGAGSSLALVELRPLHIDLLRREHRGSITYGPFVCIEITNQSGREVSIDRLEIWRWLDNVQVMRPDGSWVNAFEEVPGLEWQPGVDGPVKLPPEEGARLMVGMDGRFMSPAAIGHQAEGGPLEVTARCSGTFWYDMIGPFDGKVVNVSWSGAMGAADISTLHPRLKVDD